MVDAIILTALLCVVLALGAKGGIKEDISFPLYCPLPPESLHTGHGLVVAISNYWMLMSILMTLSSFVCSCANSGYERCLIY